MTFCFINQSTACGEEEEEKREKEREKKKQKERETGSNEADDHSKGTVYEWYESCVTITFLVAAAATDGMYLSIRTYHMPICGDNLLTQTKAIVAIA